MQCERLFRVAAKIEYKDVVVFNRFTILLKAKEHISLLFLPLVYLVICSFAYTSLMKVSLIAISAGVLILFVLVLENIILKSNRMYRNFELFLSDIAFSFFENHILIESKGTKSKGIYNVSYDQFKTVYEVKNAFYMIMKNKQSYIIDKGYMYNRQIYLLREILLKNLDINFKKLKF